MILVKLPYEKCLCSYYQVCMCYAFVTNYVCAMTVVKLPWQKCLVEQIAVTNPWLGLIEKLHVQYQFSKFDWWGQILPHGKRESERTWMRFLYGRNKIIIMKCWNGKGGGKKRWVGSVEMEWVGE